MQLLSCLVVSIIYVWIATRRQVYMIDRVIDAWASASLERLPRDLPKLPSPLHSTPLHR